MTRLAPFESSIAERYHEETKYSAEGLRRDATRHGPPDPERQPVPFKDLPGRRIPLPTEGLPLQRRGSAAAPAAERAPRGLFDLGKLSRLLWLTNGCTSVTRHPWGIHHLRAAPSAGAMYPTEVYAALRDVPGISDGVYDFQVLDHTLVCVRAGDPMGRLAGACWDDPAIGAAQVAIVLTGEWFRGSWRYRERAYRRALLDTGHVLGNLVAAAPLEGFAAVPLGSFRDEDVESLLGVDPVEEGPIAVVPVVDARRAARLPRLPQRRSGVTEWRRAVDAVGDRVPDDAPERLIAATHLAGRLGAGSEPVPPQPRPIPALPQGAIVVDAEAAPTTWDEDRPLASTIAARRSTRTYREGPVARAALLRALAYAYPDEGAFLVPEVLRTYVVTVDVEGLPAGTHLYDTSPRRLVELSRGQYGPALHHLGLGQEIFVHAAAAVIHTVDLVRAIERYGDRVYRLANLDAGHIGERLNLALLREGVGVSGCGGYFDDEMNRVLCIPESQAVLYITTLGAPAQ